MSIVSTLVASGITTMYCVYLGKRIRDYFSELKSNDTLTFEVELTTYTLGTLEKKYLRGLRQNDNDNPGMFIYTLKCTIDFVLLTIITWDDFFHFAVLIINSKSMIIIQNCHFFMCLCRRIRD